jgi:peptide/nickel transport system permease protein
MGKYVTRRLLQMIPLMLGISVIMFALIQSAPGGPEAMFLESGRFIDPTLIESYRQRLGLDQPVYIQYFKWLEAALTGDFGLSFSTSRPVSQMIAERLPATLELMLTAFTFAAVIAIPLGIFSAVRQYSLLDFFGTGFSFLGIAMPVFWFGLILQLIFSVQLGILPTSGRVTVGDASFLDQVRHLILPGIVLSLLYVAGWSRYMRSSMLSVIRREFMLTARGKGVREREVIWYHGLKNALIPVISVMALDLAGLFSGAVITETVFAWPGIGRLFIQSVYARDYPLVMGILMMGSFMVVFFNLIADIIYGWLDPRISYS